MNNFLTIDSNKCKNKVVFLRLDLDVPLKNREIEDDNRLKTSLKTIEFLLDNAKKIIICGHLGRPVGFDENLSLKPIAKWLKDKLNIPFDIQNGKLESFPGFKLGDKLFLLENIRFFKEEEKNDLEFARKLASLSDIYVNNAFASSHRNHASIVGITNFLPSFAGFSLKEEIEALEKVLKEPKRPLIIVIGGAKIETKLPLVNKMKNFADYTLVGGKIAKEYHKDEQDQKVIVANLTSDGRDISKESLNDFIKTLSTGKTIVWNGPVGKVEDSDCVDTSLKIAKEIINTNAYSVIGGGDTIDFVKKMGLIKKFSFVSMGGGAMLSFLTGESLPGVEALKKPH